MIELPILSKDEIMKAHEGEKCRDCGESIAKAQQKEDLRWFVEWVQTNFSEDVTETDVFRDLEELAELEEKK